MAKSGGKVPSGHASNRFWQEMAIICHNVAVVASCPLLIPAYPVAVDTSCRACVGFTYSFWSLVGAWELGGLGWGRLTSPSKRPTWSGRRCSLGWPYPHIYFRIPLLHIYSHLRCQQLRCERTTSSTPFKFFDFRGACALRRTPLQRKRVDKIPSWSAARALRGSRGSYKQIPSIW